MVDPQRSVTAVSDTAKPWSVFVSSQDAGRLGNRAGDRPDGQRPTVGEGRELRDSG